MRKQLHAQMDLFAPPIQPADMRGVDRQKAVALLRALLMEAATKVATPPQSNGGKVTNNDLVLFPEEAAPQFRDDAAPRNGMMPPPDSEMIAPPITE